MRTGIAVSTRVWRRRWLKSSDGSVTVSPPSANGNSSASGPQLHERKISSGAESRRVHRRPRCAVVCLRGRTGADLQTPWNGHSARVGKVLPVLKSPPEQVDEMPGQFSGRSPWRAPNEKGRKLGQIDVFAREL
jgi:hypothetical protein